MKSAPFAYRSPTTLAEALDLLAQAPDETSLLAGGQSLVPMLSMRIARPETVVDLGRLTELTGIHRSNGTVRIGAMARQRTVEHDDEIKKTLPILPEALSHVAHLAIRTRGTIGGSIAHADPAAELPAVAVALDATLALRSKQQGARTLPARDFFVAPLMTAIEPGELLEAIDVSVPPAGTGWGFAEVARTHGAFALVGAVAAVTLENDTTQSARLVLFGVGPVPVSVDWVTEMIRGRALDDETLSEVANRVSEELDPSDDVHASAAYRKRAAGALTRRALRQAAHRAATGGDS